jgi:hypothetical protein
MEQREQFDPQPILDEMLIGWESTLVIRKAIASVVPTTASHVVVHDGEIVFTGSREDAETLLEAAERIQDRAIVADRLRGWAYAVERDAPVSELWAILSGRVR